MFTEKRIGREEIFFGHVFDVYKDTVELDNNSIATRELIEHNGGVAVLAITDNDEILLVRQYRYGAQKELFELPAGKLEKNEDPRECGIRELKEETGFAANSFEYLNEMFVSPAYCTEKIYIFKATGLVEGQQQLEEDELLDVIKMPFDKAVEMCINGEIDDSKTMVGILTYAQKKER